MAGTIVKCSCGARLSVGEAAAGKKFRCPRCSAVFGVPDVEEAVLLEEPESQISSIDLPGTAPSPETPPLPEKLSPAAPSHSNAAPVRQVVVFLLALSVFIGIVVHYSTSGKKYCWFWQNECWNSDTTATAAPKVSAPGSTPASRPPPAPAVESDPPGTFRNGTKIVGREIEPGTYRTRTGAGGCYWARLAGLTGELSELVANDNTNGPAIVTIAPTDQAFQSTRCAQWTKDLSPITAGQTAPFGAGTYIVGVDISPGTWRADTPEDCYWARLRGFSGGMRDLIANDNGVGLVTIRATDKGFVSARCGAWRKVQ